MTAGLCASFILAGGVTKSVGATILSLGVSETWMPFVAGLVFLPPLALFTWMLTRIPPPSAADVVCRSERVPMTRADRQRFLVLQAFGLLTIIGVFSLVTVLRSVRDDFAPELLKGLRVETTPGVFTWVEVPVMLGVLAACGLTVFLRDNRRAFHTALGVALAGLLLMILATTAWQFGFLDGFSFMVLIGLGLYLPYVIVHTTILERLIALTRGRSNMGFLMYLADAFGYLGYATVILGWGIFGRGSFLGFFLACAWAVSVLALVLLLVGWIWFARMPAPQYSEAD